jgi:CheY-like chemotaxis protein
VDVSETSGNLFIVDDNADNLAVLVRILREAGHKVRVANSGRSALAAMAQRPPDLVLLDINMPDLSGYEVCERLLAQPETRELPVIFLSALDDVDDKLFAFRAGGVDYITKPFRVEEVLARVETQLRVARLRRELQRKNEELERRQQELLSAWDNADEIFAVLVDLLPGRVLDGRYRLEERIGAGGFAAVYRGTDLDSARQVAIKVLRPGAEAKRARQRLQLEGASALRVNHPNAVAVLDTAPAGGRVAYLVMELLSGRTLADELAACGPLPIARCARLLLPVCEVLAEAHRAGVIHRDVKPANIVLHRSNDQEIVKLVDFGIAQAEAQEGAPSSSGRLVGTPVYMSPERLLGRTHDQRADVYALGATAYELLAGRPPLVVGDDPLAAFLLRCTTEPPPPLHALRPEVPEPLERAVLAALEKDPDRRASLAELATAIVAVVEEDERRRLETAARVTLDVPAQRD